MTLIIRRLKTETGSSLPREDVLIFVNLWAEERCSIYPQGLFCTCNPLFAKHTSDSANLPSWSVWREWVDPDPSNLWLVGSVQLLCWSETNCSKIPLLSDKLLKWSTFPALPSSPDLLVFFYYWFNFATYGTFSCTGSIRRGFGNLLLKPRDLDLLSEVSKLGEIPLSSLLGHILESFDWKIFFLELNEHELIPPYLSWPEVKFDCCFQGVPFFWNKIYLPL